MAFIDEVELDIKAGKGGDGVVRWIREKFKPKGGPGGGNGGRGGDVYAEAVSDLQILDQYQFQKKFAAENGEPGEGNNKEGKDGADLVLTFPVGSIITNQTSGESIELTEVGQRVHLLRGGQGGLGNTYFKSSRNTTPYESTPGKAGEKSAFHIELQLIADIGLVGLPSAGKSSLLNALTNAQSKVGAYHFTTLEPHLGVTKNKTILADIPGLIEGASNGKGLGHKFLRHIRRTKALAHCISVENDSPVASYNEIRRELENFDPALGEKAELILLTKIDLVDEETREKMIQDLEEATGKMVCPVSTLQPETLAALQPILDNLAL